MHRCFWGVESYFFFWLSPALFMLENSFAWMCCSGRWVHSLDFFYLIKN